MNVKHHKSHTDVLRVQYDALHDSKGKGKNWPGTGVSETQSCHRSQNEKNRHNAKRTYV